MTIVDFPAGSHIARAAEMLIEAAEMDGRASGTFNDIPIYATPDSTVAEITAAYERAMSAACEAYRNSPEGIAAAEERDRSRASAQLVHDILMRRLRSLNFSDDVAVLDWLCEMQPASDHAGVVVRAETIIATFAKHGFASGVFIDDDFDPKSRDIFHRWLVGQALDGLHHVGAIHGIVHKFAAEWRESFGAASLGTEDGPALAPNRVTRG